MIYIAYILVFDTLLAIKQIGRQLVKEKKGNTHLEKKFEKNIKEEEERKKEERHKHEAWTNYHKTIDDYNKIQA